MLDNEKKIIKKFSQDVLAVENCRFIRRFVEKNPTSILEILGTDDEEEEWEVFLLRIRRLTGEDRKGTSCSIKRVTEILQSYETDADLTNEYKEMLKSLESWKEYKVFMIAENSEVVRCRMLVDQYANGNIFHNNWEKSEWWDKHLGRHAFIEGFGKNNIFSYYWFMLLNAQWLRFLIESKGYLQT